MATWLVLPDYVKLAPPMQPRLGNKRTPLVHWRIVLLAGGTAWLLTAGLVGWLYARQRPALPHKSVAVADPVALKEVLSAGEWMAQTSKQSTEAEIIKEEKPSPGPTSEPAPEQTEVAAKAGLPPSELPPEDDTPSWQKYGTQVAFLSNPVDAARQATKEHKLLFVLHLSGNFEDQQFT